MKAMTWFLCSLQFVLLSLAGWGLLGYGVAKAFSSLKKPPPKEEVKLSMRLFNTFFGVKFS